MKNRVCLAHVKTGYFVVASLLLIALAVSNAQSAEANGTTASENQPSSRQDWGRLRDTLSENGLDVSLNYTGEYLGNPIGGAREGYEYQGLVTADLELDLSTAIGWNGARIYGQAYNIHGRNLTERFIQDLNVASNIEAPDTTLLVEFWLEQSLRDDLFNIRVGQLALDTEFGLCDPGSLFINSGFGAIPTLSLNVTSPIFPQGTPGLRFRWNPTEQWYVQAAIFQGDPGDLASYGHGTYWNFNRTEGALAIAETGWLLNQGVDDTGLPGVYRIGFTDHFGKFPDVATGIDQGGNQSVYLVAQQTAHENREMENRGLDLFARASIATQRDRSIVDFHFDTGFNLRQPFRSRAEDVLGVGFVYTHISRRLRLSNPGSGDFDHESILEASYLAQITPHIALQPDVQYIFDPGGRATAANALVIGARCSIDF